MLVPKILQDSKELAEGENPLSSSDSMKALDFHTSFKSFSVTSVCLLSDFYRCSEVPKIEIISEPQYLEDKASAYLFASPSVPIWIG